MKIDSWCFVLPGRSSSSAQAERSEAESDQAVVGTSLQGLYSSLKQSTRDSPKIRVHPGALTDESGFRTADRSFSDPLGSSGIESYLPYEFTCDGMLQRLSSLIEKQSDPLLFNQSLIRICPCRDYIKDQIASCRARV
ncbi:unnamed protein product [Pleuronectes platessa]|uniref:alpha-1,6-mannosyl-glycoprotein 6-beta-N-acetylglucosaminyltransferase n=1 Tax=Pleuronectes platessa TaxID=8262 RepID=A0A9N7YZE7_PLEPL|nr:unnamed protein product [Pleuronectes platessa]